MRPGPLLSFVRPPQGSPISIPKSNLLHCVYSILSPRCAAALLSRRAANRPRIRNLHTLHHIPSFAPCTSHDIAFTSIWIRNRPYTCALPLPLASSLPAPSVPGALAATPRRSVVLRRQTPRRSTTTSSLPSPDQFQRTIVEATRIPFRPCPGSTVVGLHPTARSCRSKKQSSQGSKKQTKPTS